jgi:hypothetical protein
MDMEVVEVHQVESTSHPLVLEAENLLLVGPLVCSGDWIHAEN